MPRHQGNSQPMKLTAPTAMPTPKTIPARAFLAAALAEGEHQTATHDADERQAARDRSGKCVLEDGDGLEPGALRPDRDRSA